MPKPMVSREHIIRVLLVDDDPTVLVSLNRVLSRQPDCEVIGEAVDGEQAVRLTEELQPDVVVMDVQMPKLSGFQATKVLRSRGVHTPILFLTADPGARARVGRLTNVQVLIKADSSIADTLRAVRSAAGAT